MRGCRNMNIQDYWGCVRLLSKINVLILGAQESPKESAVDRRDTALFVE
jgi:hypothetical protein